MIDAEKTIPDKALAKKKSSIEIDTCDSIRSVLAVGYCTNGLEKKDTKI